MGCRDVEVFYFQDFNKRFDQIHPTQSENEQHIYRGN